jgi:hypothetical protein
MKLGGGGSETRKADFRRVFWMGAYVEVLGWLEAGQSWSDELHGGLRWWRLGSEEG